MFHWPTCPVVSCRLTAACRRWRCPTRTIVAPSSMATSKSWLIPIDNSRSGRRGRRHRRDELVAQLAQPAEVRPHVLRIVEERRQQHQPRQPHSAARERSFRQRAAARRARPRAWSARRPGPPGAAPPARPRPRLPRGRRPAASRAGRSSECRRKAAAALRALFDCRWPTRCQRTGRSGGRLDLLQRLLDAVLAEVDAARRPPPPARIRRARSSRRRRGGRPPATGRAGGRARDPGADDADALREACSVVHGMTVGRWRRSRPETRTAARRNAAWRPWRITWQGTTWLPAIDPSPRGRSQSHYFLSCDTIAFAWAAYWPSGASVQVLLEHLRGLGQLAEVDEAHPQLVVRVGVLRVRP